MLGIMYIYKQGVAKRDMQRAKYWLQKAFDNGDEEAKNIWNDFEMWDY